MHRARSVDFIYALDPVSVGLPAMLAAKLTSKKFLVRLGGDYAWEQGRLRFNVTQTLDEFVVDTKSQPVMVRIMSAVQTRVTNAATRVVVPSHYLKKIVTKWGIPDKRISVIYSTLVPLTPTQHPSVTKEDMHITGHVIVTAGRLVPWKGILALIEVIALLKEKYPKVTLVVAGDGPQKEILYAKVKKMHLEDNVRFLGNLSKTDLANCINAADVFVFNTAYEGLSHQLLEVMQLQVPIVTTFVGGNIELLTHGETAMLVEYNDVTSMYESCDILLSQPSLATKQAQLAKARTDDFSRAKAVHEIVALLRQIYKTPTK